MIKQERIDERLHVKTTRRQMDEVRKIARYYDCTVSYFVRKCIDKGLSEYKFMIEVVDM